MEAATLGAVLVTAAPSAGRHMESVSLAGLWQLEGAHSIRRRRRRSLPLSFSLSRNSTPI